MKINGRPLKGRQVGHSLFVNAKDFAKVLADTRRDKLKASLGQANSNEPVKQAGKHTSPINAKFVPRAKRPVDLQDLMQGLVRDTSLLDSVLCRGELKTPIGKEDSEAFDFVSDGNLKRMSTPTQFEYRSPIRPLYEALMSLSNMSALQAACKARLGEVDGHFHGFESVDHSQKLISSSTEVFEAANMPEAKSVIREQREMFLSPSLAQCFFNNAANPSRPGSKNNGGHWTALPKTPTHADTSHSDP